MTDQALHETSSRLLPGRRSAWGSFLRVALEFMLLFGAAVVLDRVILLPVILLSLEHGLGAAVAAALAACGLYAWFDLPPALVTEDIYAYLGRVAAEPVG